MTNRERDPAEQSPLGPRSARLAELRRLSRRRKDRARAGRFVVDGPTLLVEALDAGIDVIEVYAEPSAPPDALDRARRAGTPVVAVSAGALDRATDPVTSQGVAAVASIPSPTDGPFGSGLVVVAAGLSDPGNFGAVVRVAEAAGASAVVSCADAVDPWNPKCVRASAGSAFRIPIVDGGPTDACLARLRAAGMTVLGCDATADRSYTDVDLRGDLAIVVGNESHGLDARARDAVDQLVAIPMAGGVDSLNAATAAAVLAFEAARQRRSGDSEGAGPWT